MSDTSSSDAEKPMEQLNEDLPEAMGHISVNTNNSDETSTPPKSLSNMPVDVVRPIIEKLDYRQQLRLRKVSKSLRAVVDNKKPACKSIEIHCGLVENSLRAPAIDICFNGQRVMYTKQIHYYGNLEDYDIIVVKDDFKEVAFDDLACTLKNPKLQLEKLRFFVYENMINYYNRIKCVLESLERQLPVKEIHLRMSSLSSLLSVLPYLKPGVLEEIALNVDFRGVDWRNESIGMDQIARLEQWKQAKELRTRNPFDIFPMEYATHFKRLKFYEGRLDENKFIRIKNYLSKMDNFEHCIIRNWFSFADPDLIEQIMGAPVYSNTTEEVFHHPIPDSDCFFEIKKSTDSDEICFHITKKMRKGNC